MRKVMDTDLHHVRSGQSNTCQSSCWEMLSKKHILVLCHLSRLLFLCLLGENWKMIQFIHLARRADIVVGSSYAITLWGDICSKWALMEWGGNYGIKPSYLIGQQPPIAICLLRLFCSGAQEGKYDEYHNVTAISRQRNAQNLWAGCFLFALFVDVGCSSKNRGTFRLEVLPLPACDFAAYGNRFPIR